MPKASTDVIIAPATPSGVATRAVLRLSGASLFQKVESLFPEGVPFQTPPSRGSWKGELAFASDAVIPVHFLCFPGPSSATGEDVLELHLPGSPVVLDMLLARLLDRGARLAEAGEFTKRAFLNGVLDLTQAEAVLALVGSRHKDEATAAASVLIGSLGETLTCARDALRSALIQVEATLDFEEGDAQEVPRPEIETNLKSAIQAVSRGLNEEQQRRRQHDGKWRIALLGAPNAGKSTLFRRLTGSSVLTSSEPGTTRDRIEAVWQPMDVGASWVLCDLPGLEGDPADERDAAARENTLSHLHDIDLWWCIVDAHSREAQLPELPKLAPALLILTKQDLSPTLSADFLRAAESSMPVLWADDSSGFVSQLASTTASMLEDSVAHHAALSAVGERHQFALSASLEALGRASSWLETDAALDLVAEELRSALEPLGALVGEWTPEDLLDELFASFCIGK